jgi:hypothetical protein
MTRKPSVSQLYKQFEKAEAAYRAIPEVEEKPFERAVDRSGPADRANARRHDRRHAVENPSVRLGPDPLEQHGTKFRQRRANY